MQIIFYGHACVGISGSLTILIDPFLTGNPLCKTNPQEVSADYILVTHAHYDHLGDTVEIAKRTGATVVCTPELECYLKSQGCEKFHTMNIGGAFTFPNGFKVKMTQAKHTSSLPDGTTCGAPCGFLFWLDDVSFYHAGDTGLFGDIGKIIGKHEINVAFLPIGGNYTMGPIDAMTAVGWLDCDFVIPIHYNTFDNICQDPEIFKDAVEGRTDSRCLILDPGEHYVLK